ncbi:acyltransferase family protein [Acinetobacter shaoyimingii]|uniref:Acyltransferase n=1 Tax=Acinetobacter shaoyimingii TaxID=2715164 RepID=A0A6G8RXM1_9GAMM|nr:acyltransferase [Acinetobacter shaoyimingii]QIO06647.1 acyltransferase [Acinetobacter shaoyimingii]
MLTSTRKMEIEDDVVKLNSAESIRGLACLAVVFSHLSLTFFPYLHSADMESVAKSPIQSFIHHSPFAFWYSGTAAVFVFFVLSGFVLSYAILRKPELVEYKIKTMLVKRYPRLAIPVLGSCLIAWATFKFFHIDSSRVYSWFHEFVSQYITLKHAIYEGLIGSFFFAESDTNWVLWTMNIELIGSLVLFVLLYLRQINQTLFFVGSIVFPLLAWWWKGEGFLLGILSFVIGIYYYLYGKQLKLVPAVLLFLFGLYLAGAHNSSWSYQWIYAWMGERTYDYCNFFAGVCIVYAVLMSVNLSKHLDQRFLVWLGKLSFSIYLLHLMLIYLIALPLFNYLSDHGVNYVVSALTASLIFIGLTLFVAEFYSRWVDQFAIKISNGLANRIVK